MNEFIEKLIGRLEERKTELANINAECKPTKEIKDKNYGYYTAMNHAISIVNQLAEEYNNDFCEWKQEDEEGFSNCRFDYQEIISDEVSGFVYCPYCGKKIKIAPYQPKGE